MTAGDPQGQKVASGGGRMWERDTQHQQQRTGMETADRETEAERDGEGEVDKESQG